MPPSELVEVHLIDGTYELFRHFFAVPSRKAADGSEVGALRGVLGNIVMLLEGGATHVAVATDHVVESFRNDLWPGYKDGSGIEPDLLSQFHPTEEALGLLGVAVWPMIEFEADDGMAAGAAMAADDDRVRQVFICTPDKDLGQCVGGKVVQWDRRADEIIDTAGVEAKFGVRPESIPDYLGLVGDSADGFRHPVRVDVLGPVQEVGNSERNLHVVPSGHAVPSGSWVVVCGSRRGVRRPAGDVSQRIGRANSRTHPRSCPSLRCRERRAPPCPP